MKKLYALFPLVLLAVTACGTPSKTERAERIGSWEVMVSGTGTRSALCYAAAEPSKSEGTLEHRDARPYLMATRRPSGKIEMSALPGYAYMPGSKAELAIDDDTYDLFYKGSVAWARSDSADREIIRAIEEADDIQVRGLSAGGLTSVDHYSSSGFAEAIQRVRELCP